MYMLALNKIRLPYIDYVEIMQPVFNSTTPFAHNIPEATV